jgi:hypothetical protein
MKLICSIGLVVGILAQPTSLKADWMMSGVGVVSCGKIAEDYRKDATYTHTFTMNWAQGYMSGANAVAIGSYGKYRDLQAMTVDEQQQSLRDYCDKHPVATFSKAVIDLYNKLPAKSYTPSTSE